MNLSVSFLSLWYDRRHTPRITRITTSQYMLQVLKYSRGTGTDLRVNRRNISMASVRIAGVNIKGFDHSRDNERPTKHPVRGRIMGVTLMLVFSIKSIVEFLNLRAAIMATIEVKMAVRQQQVLRAVRMFLSCWASFSSREIAWYVKQYVGRIASRSMIPYIWYQGFLISCWVISRTFSIYSPDKRLGAVCMEGSGVPGGGGVGLRTLRRMVDQPLKREDLSKFINIMGMIQGVSVPGLCEAIKEWYDITKMIREYDYLFKIVIVGNSSVGKSSLLRRFVDDEFTESYLATIGVDFRFKSLNVDGSIVKLQIWDTAGQERFRTITSAYYKGAHGVYAVYDLTNEQSFQDVGNFWLGEIEKYSEPNVKMAIMGNKCDAEGKKVDRKVVEQFAQTKGVQEYEVSAKTGDGVLPAVTEMVKELMKIHPKAEKFEQKNKVVEEIQRKKQEFQLRSGASSVGEKKKSCC